MAETEMLMLQDVHKTFNPGTATEKKALNGVSLTLNSGDFVTVIGGNGAGKSTMLNAIAGTFHLDCGILRIAGRDVAHLPEYKRAAFLGRVFQDPNSGTAASMNIEENLALASRRGLPRGLRWGITADERARYREKLAALDLGLETRLSSKVGLLSGGQRQALTLLMATLKEPELLLLDEHTAALDPKTAEKVLSLTRRLIRENHLTALMVTHNMKDALALGNRTIMMHEGRIILDLNAEQKQHMTVEDLLAQFEKVSGLELANDRMLLV
jgi:putative ABC transport system ATP-binding protein